MNAKQPIWCYVILRYPACDRDGVLYARCRDVDDARVVATRLRRYAADYAASENARLTCARAYADRRISVVGRFDEGELCRRLLAAGLSVVGNAVSVAMALTVW